MRYPCEADMISFRRDLRSQFNSLGASVDSPGESSSLPCQVEADIEVQEMGKDPSSDSANGSLGDVGEDGVP